MCFIGLTGMHYENIAMQTTKSFGFQISKVLDTNCAPLVADLFLFCYQKIFHDLFLTRIKPISLKHLHVTQRLYI